jgi:IMP dehydrogenase
VTVPQFKQLRRAYGFDEVAIVPGDVTINPELVELGLDIGPFHFEIPFLASAMDAVVDPKFAIAMARAGGLAVLNLEGVWTRYDDPGSVLKEVASVSRDESTALLQHAYQAPIRDDLIATRIHEIKAGHGVAAVAMTPMNAKRMAPIVQEAGADLIFIQSTVTTARHESKSIEGLRFDKLLRSISVPVVVGNTVGFNATLEIMRTGVAGVLHHRRRDPHRRGRLQVLRGGRRRDHDGFAVRGDDGSARARLSLGDGDASREPAARDTRERRREHDPR